MLKRKPMYPNDLYPIEILGVDDYQFLKMHLKAALKIDGPENFDKYMNKKFTESERVALIEMYQKLRDYGFIPSGVDKHGEVTWKIIVRGELQEFIESHYPLKCDNCTCGKDVCQGYSDEEIYNMKKTARQGQGGIGRSMPGVSETDIAAENY